MIPELEFEVERLNTAVEIFAKEMKEKLRSKVLEGYWGWDDASNHVAITNLMARQSLDQAMGLKKDQEVDIANYAMMLWYLNRNKKG